jgi:2-keto-4-pentenoate hydratase/2-oxohepta-3-ene-1,7-dioic acid hydratase in catechol pathway
MKLLRYGPKGYEKPAILDEAGTIRDLSSVVGDIDSATISRTGLARLAEIDPATLPSVDPTQRIGPCVAHTPMFLAIGLNFLDHARESGMPVPEEPILFMKSTGSIAGPNDNVPMPVGATKLDWEVELGVVIGEECRHVDVHAARDFIAGYCVVNDVSERAFQMERGGQWVKGKSYDGFGPVGPYLVTKDEIPDIQDLEMFLDVNGERRQTGNTKTMIFSVAQIVSYVSDFMTLRPGDIITTGTPPGVGLGMKPPTYLSIGDEMHLGITGLGKQRQTVVSTAS